MTIVAKFDIAYHQYLNEQGELTQALPEFAKKNPEAIVDMYRLMTLMRVFDSKAVALQRTGKMGTYAGILGQEAISVAIGAAMQKDDALCPSYREYGAFIQRGATLKDIFAYWGGDERGSDFNNKSDLPICVPIGTQYLHAAGIATAFKLRKQPRVAVSVIGDGGTSQGDFYEGLNLAGDWNLPCVFVVNNNQWAISVSRLVQTHCETLAQKAIAAGFEGVQVDGNDIIGMREILEKALHKAQSGKGPTLIEAITYRLCDHTTADDAKRYRSNDEVETAWTKEPLIRTRKYLMTNKLWTEEQEQTLLKECAAEVEQAVADYTSMSPQEITSIVDYMYAKWPASLADQREILLNM